jgi:putative peptidoglycan lipid II flippase
MLLRASLVSFALLLASRLAGLARDSAQAATFGASGLGDVAVLLFTWPDLVASLVAGGVLSYVLVPRWARLQSAHIQREQVLLSRTLLAAGVAVALAMQANTVAWVSWLAPGLPSEWRDAAMGGWRWAALAVPLALWAAAGSTRLQQLGDFTGLYGANLVVNGVLIAGLLLFATEFIAIQPINTLGLPSIFVQKTGWGGHLGVHELGVHELGVFCVVVLLLLAGLARLGWQAWRLARHVRADTPAHKSRSHSAQGLNDAAQPSPTLQAPHLAFWVAALLCAALPVALPVLARSWGSGAAAGELAVFHFGWKLVELPAALLIQVISVVALTALSREAAALALAEAADQPAAATKIKALLMRATGVAWALGVASAAGLVIGAEALAQLLFGWGKANASDVQRMGDVARMAAWALPGMSLLSVLTAYAAARQRLMAASVAHMVGAVVFVVVLWALQAGASPRMAAVGLAAAFSAAGAVLVVMLNIGAHLPWASMLAGLGVLGIWATISPQVQSAGLARPVELALATVAAVTALMPLLLSADLVHARKASWQRVLRLVKRV